MASEATYRDAHRRSHKLLGTYLALWAWANKVDCVVLSRKQLLSFLDLERMQDKRLKWLKEDVLSLFDHSWSTVDKAGVYATLYLSRIPFPSAATRGAMSDGKRIVAMAQEGIRAAIVEIPSEREIVRVMAELSHGLADLPFSGNGTSS